MIPRPSAIAWGCLVLLTGCASPTPTNRAPLRLPVEAPSTAKDLVVPPDVVPPAVPLHLESFNYQGVQLTDSRWKRQVDEIRKYYLKISNADLLIGFRERAGNFMIVGQSLGGWYGADKGNAFGQILGGLARMYAATGDSACRRKAVGLMNEWAKTIEADGFFFYSKKPDAPCYTYEKMVGGLLDVYQYCGRPEALVYLDRITGWAEKNLERSLANRPEAQECYTLSENLYRAYLLTGEKRYRDFAEVWEYPLFWNNPGKDHPDPLMGGHAYSHVNSLNGAAAAYLVKGDPYYLNTVVHSFDNLQADRCYASGGYGPDENLGSTDYLGRALESSHYHFETQCGSWAAFKLTKYLIRFTGDARFGDWMEKLLYNGIGASIPMDLDGGVMYFSDYNVHGGEKNNTSPWSCCTGTRPQAAADYVDQVYFKGPDTVAVNLYLPSKVAWACRDVAVQITQETDFPESDTSSFTVECDQPVSFTLKFRVPGWAAGPLQATVNEQPAKLAPDELHWAGLTREWQPGDRVQLSLPMRLTRKPLSDQGPSPVAILCGPVLMAMQTRKGNPMEQLSREDLVEVNNRVVPQPVRGAVTYRFTDHPDIVMRPFYAYKKGELYYAYLDEQATAPSK